VWGGVSPYLLVHPRFTLGNDSCFFVNAVLRHGETHVKDYQPIKRPFAYNLDLVKKLTNQQFVINN